MRDVTQLLSDLRSGDPEAARELFDHAYAELRKLAEILFAQQPHDHTLQPTALVHEAFLKLIGPARIHAADRRQFFALAAQAMRNLLVDHARARNRQKRGDGWRRVTLSDSATTSQPCDILELDEALKTLADMDERQARLVELRYFGGFSIEEAAEVLNISRATASDDWRFARAFLQRRLQADGS